MDDSRSAAESLKRSLIEQIDSGALPVGSRLGSEREIAAQHGVSRSTLREALGSLEEAGLVRRVPGRGGGTFIGRAKVVRDLSGVQSVPGILASQGYSSGTRVISTQLSMPSPQVRESLRLEAGEVVVEIRRIRLADDSPISLDHGYFPANRFPGLMEKPLGGSLYDLLRDQYGVSPESAEEQIEVVQATDLEASLLAVAPSSPLLLVQRVTQDTEGRPFEYAKDVFRSDRIRLRVRTQGQGIRVETVQDGDVMELRSAPLPSEEQRV